MKVSGNGTGGVGRPLQEIMAMKHAETVTQLA